VCTALALPGCGLSLGKQVLCNTDYKNKKKKNRVRGILKYHWPRSALRTVGKAFDFTKIAASPGKADLHLGCSGGQGALGYREI